MSLYTRVILESHSVMYNVKDFVYFLLFRLYCFFFSSIRSTTGYWVIFKNPSRHNFTIVMRMYSLPIIYGRSLFFWRYFKFHPPIKMAAIDIYIWYILESLEILLKLDVCFIFCFLWSNDVMYWSHVTFIFGCPIINRILKLYWPIGKHSFFSLCAV